jgi:hypothetical protein
MDKKFKFLMIFGLGLLVAIGAYLALSGSSYLLRLIGTLFIFLSGMLTDQFLFLIKDN